ncbi:MAG TPA: hypothetical protein VNQ99_12250 [Xanthobacteraceae bacterium]|nr:hypothetical protein [Xanthobacteraceae bacterium]
MSKYVVSYDLRREVTSTDWYRLHETLKTAVDYCWPLQSIWIIETPRTPADIIGVLRSQGVIDDNDGIIVLEITGKGAFRRVASQETANWLAQHLYQV